jgi:hypothetical protein
MESRGETTQQKEGTKMHNRYSKRMLRWTCRDITEDHKAQGDARRETLIQERKAT